MTWNNYESPPLSFKEDKLVLFQHTAGPLTGLYSIMGRVSSLGIKPGQTLPTDARNFTAQGRTIPFASLVKVTPTYVLYREPLKFGKPARGFDRNQQ